MIFTRTLALFLIIAGLMPAANLDINPGGNGFGLLYQPSGTVIRSFGQTFNAPGNLLTSFTFYVDPLPAGQTANSAFPDTLMTLRAYIFAFDTGNAQPTGSVLYASSPFPVNTDQSASNPQTFNFSGLSVALTPGTQYIAFLSSAGSLSATSNRVFVLGGGSNPYAAGAGAFLAGPNDPASFTSSTWTVGNTDLRFTATFTGDVPEASTALLLGTGLAGLYLLRRRG